ncbi:hypothetical protein R1flu_021158 [Riccia fluitans]|uniref:Uncharacterized protein n=1 Tax=Riccia fluitans TaxID=41844 RepID=A0ABD1ZQ34_9MARC
MWIPESTAHYGSSSIYKPGRKLISAPSSSSFFTASPFSPSSPVGARRFVSQIARLPGEIGVLQSFMPLYSATANSRLVSRLGTNGDAPILQDDFDGT